MFVRIKLHLISLCSEGMTECFFEKVVTLHYMVYFNFFGCVLVPLFLMLVIYIHIFMAARRHSSRSFLQREVRAAKSLAIIVGLFALCWLPLHIINCYNHLCQNCERPHILVMNIAIILSHANSAVNPFIYAYRIREFRSVQNLFLRQMKLFKTSQTLIIKNSEFVSLYSK
uniref:G-protein coupled receptors family 1 profile domain-containing protein n=1 Tax=Oryzias melastigma TaxID=30732 RepID=A0A3B3CU10_ORYME